MSKPRLLIIGAGPTGLAVSMAYGGPSTILEQAPEVGGLCRSVTFGGGVFDLGGHSFHSPHQPVADLVEGLMAGRWNRQRRDARVLFQGRLIDYPFQTHFHQIADPAIAAACQETLPASLAGAARAENLEDWLVARFGEGVARHFMLPYNRKLWARDLRRVSCEWVGERIAGAEPATTGLRARRPLQSRSEVGYPADGGFDQIFRAMAMRCGPIARGETLVGIDAAARTARTASGARFAWDRLVSTMPVPALLRAIDGCPSALVAAADRLEAVSLKIVMVLIAGPVGAAPQRVYVASPDMPAHKIAFNHTSSPALRRRPVQAVMAEVAYSPDKPPPADDDLATACVDGLAAAGLIASSAAALETRIVDLPFGYPVYTHERPRIMAAIRAWLAPLGIHTVGRFGGWDYVNSDACIWQGLQLASLLEQPADAAA